tara:strand:+ start:191 stop:511 length:321 start_codon:yes stop_codon:yes gene_type:complete
MAVENVAKFMQMMSENEEVLGRMQELVAQGSKLDALQVLASEYGYEFAADEALAWGRVAASDDEQPLSDGALEVVSGGAGATPDEMPVIALFESMPELRDLLKTRV